MGARCRECEADMSGYQWNPTGRCESCDPTQGGTIWVVVGECRGCGHNVVKCAWPDEMWAISYLDSQCLECEHYCPRCKQKHPFHHFMVACRGMKTRVL